MRGNLAPIRNQNKSLHTFFANSIHRFLFQSIMGVTRTVNSVHLQPLLYC